MMFDRLIVSIDKGNIINRSDFCNLCNAGSDITMIWSIEETLLKLHYFQFQYF